MARREIRYRRGAAAFSPWETAAGDFEINALAAGTAVEINVRTIDNAGNVSPVAAGTFTAAVGNAAAAFDTLATEYVQEEYGYTAPVAQQWIDTQASGGDLAEDLGTNTSTNSYYGGIWYENETRKVHINMNSATGTSAISARVAAFGLTSSVIYHTMPHTEGQLLARVQDAEGALANDISSGWVEVNYSTADGLVFYTVAAGAAQPVRDRVAAHALVGSIPYQIIASAENQFLPTLQGCGVLPETTAPICDPPLRGGVKIFNTQTPDAQPGSLFEVALTITRMF